MYVGVRRREPPRRSQAWSYAWSARGGTVNVRADRPGRFTADLAPGTYQVTITDHGPTADGLPMQPTPGAIVVPHAGGHPVRLVISIK